MAWVREGLRRTYLLVLEGEGLLRGLVVQLGEGGGVGLHITGALSSFWGASTSSAEQKSSTWAQPWVVPSSSPPPSRHTRQRSATASAPGTLLHCTLPRHRLAPLPPSLILPLLTRLDSTWSSRLACIHAYIHTEASRGPYLHGPSTAGDGVDASGHGLGDAVASSHQAGQLHPTHTHTTQQVNPCERLRCVSRLVSIRRGDRGERDRASGRQTQQQEDTKEGRKDPRPTLRPRPVTHVWSMASWATGAHPTQRTNTRHIHMPSAHMPLHATQGVTRDRMCCSLKNLGTSRSTHHVRA